LHSARNFRLLYYTLKKEPNWLFDTDNMIEPQNMEQELTFIGFVDMIDPLRIEVKDSINEAKMVGITSVTLSDEAFTGEIHDYRVFARVSPEHKVKIVKYFK